MPKSAWDRDKASRTGRREHAVQALEGAVADNQYVEVHVKKGRKLSVRRRMSDSWKPHVAKTDFTARRRRKQKWFWHDGWQIKLA